MEDVNIMEATQLYITIQQLTEECRKTIGTPFHHGGRISGKNGGLDCGGVIIVALRNLGFEVHDKPHYNRGDGLKDMEEVLLWNNFFPEKSAASKPLSETDVKPGDLILLRTSTMYHHLVYFTEDRTIIHAWFTTGKNEVVETPMIPEWWFQIHSIWRFKWLH